MAEIINEPCGVLIINKPQGPTSHDIVNRIRRLYSTKKVGHTGTLDPMATGVLPILLGRAAKAAEYLTAEDKHYIAGLRLGLTTDTEDITGKVLSEYKGEMPDFETVKNVVSSFAGEIEQIPPMYSALKRDGRKLCDLARAGITVEREARPITVYRLDVTPLGGDDYALDVAFKRCTLYESERRLYRNRCGRRCNLYFS